MTDEETLCRFIVMVDGRIYDWATNKLGVNRHFFGHYCECNDCNGEPDKEAYDD